MKLLVNIESASYGMGQVLQAVKFEFQGPGMLLIAGRNGVGKTTLLRSILGLMPDVSGEIRIGEHNPFAESPDALARGGIIFMPQEGGVFDDLTVEENIELTKVPSEAVSALEILPGWSSRMKQKAGTLSGGERKILGLARALGQKPSILLVDEPTEGVWHELLPVITGQLSNIAQNALVVVVEQNLSNFVGTATSIIVMENGSIALHGSPKDVASNPALESLLTL